MLSIIKTLFFCFKSKYLKVDLFIHTIKYLKFIQVYYRIYYYIRNKILGREPRRRKVPNSKIIVWDSTITYSNRYFEQNRFQFLNIEHSFSEEIDWNYSNNGKLWTYNLNYFDFLNQSNITNKEGLGLIQKYIEKDSVLKDGKEPYPISLRIINWVKFLSKNQHKNSKIDEVLFHHCQILLYNLEFHLLANHLLENAFSLLFGAYYFQDNYIYSMSKKLLIQQLDEQVLNDGSHYELSAMYHQILFHRLLDCIQLIRLNAKWKYDELLSFLENKASAMRSWLEVVTYQNGDIPLMGDSAFGIAPTSAELLSFADHLSIKSSELTLSDSGYRKIVKDDFELFLDVGNIRPSYQPGHAHADTFNFELYFKKQPIIVDRGISTYNICADRIIERSTSSHNTVAINSLNSSEVWGGFRVGKRAKVKILNRSKTKLQAVHDGYSNHQIFHKRTWLIDNKSIMIEDELTNYKNKNCAYLHFHPEVNELKISDNNLKGDSFEIQFEGEYFDLAMEDYYFNYSFNDSRLAQRLVINFKSKLSTKIILLWK